MKKIIKYATLFLLVIIQLGLIAQNTLIIYTKYPESLSFVDNLNSELAKNNLWDENTGGYVLNYNDINKTYVQSLNTASFKISTSDKLTKLILMNSEEKLSLVNCLNSEKYCCERLTDKQKKGTEKLFAMAVMKKSGIKDVALVFNENNLTEFARVNDILIEWESDTSIASLQIFDMTDIEVIWESKGSENNSFKGNSMSNEIKSKFNTDHTYQINIEVLANNEIAMATKYSFEFQLKTLAFTTNKYYFPSTESLNFKWVTDEKISQVAFRELYASTNLWESNNIQVDNFNLSDIIKENNLILKAGVDYELVIKISNPDLFQQEFSYPFSILLNKEESEEMKLLLEGL